MDIERATVKLKAIQDKNTAKIFQKHTWLPNIGYATSEQQIRDWLKIRSDVLIEALSAKDDKEITDKLAVSLTIFNKDPETVDTKTLSAKDFDELCKIRLIKFALGEQPKGELIK